MRRAALSLVLSSLGLSACSLLGPTMPVPQLAIASEAGPAPDTIQTTEVGEAMLRAARVLQGPALKATRLNTLCEDRAKKILMPSGHEYVESRDAQGQLAYCGKFIWENKIAGNEKTEIDECLVPAGESRWSLYFNKETCPESVAMEPVTHIAAAAQNQQKSVIYTGHSGNEIFISYREFAADPQQASVNQDVRFDIADDPIIGVKGARFEVLDVNNLQIRFRLLKGFNPAPAPETLP